MEIMFEVAKLAVIGTGSSVLIGVLFTVIHIGRDRWREAGALSGSARQVLQGEVLTDRDGQRDPRVSKGKVWDKATKHWRRQGKLSDEYIKNMVS